MNYKLIKVTSEHYVVVDSSFIVEMDWCVCDDPDSINYKKIIQNKTPFVASNWSKITHSTQQLEGVKKIDLKEIKNLLENHIQKKVYSLCQSECVVDLYGKATEDGMLIGIASYQQALEDNKNKIYTEHDLLRAIEMAKEREYIAEGLEPYKYSPGEIILSFRKKKNEQTEWEIEFDTEEKIRLK